MSDDHKVMLATALLLATAIVAAALVMARNW
jgi:hypothetical protein